MLDDKLSQTDIATQLRINDCIEDS